MAKKEVTHLEVFKALQTVSGFIYSQDKEQGLANLLDAVEAHKHYFAKGAFEELNFTPELLDILANAAEYMEDLEDEEEPPDAQPLPPGPILNDITMYDVYPGTKLRALGDGQGRGMCDHKVSAGRIRQGHVYTVKNTDRTSLDVPYGYLEVYGQDALFLTEWFKPVREENAVDMVLADGNWHSIRPGTKLRPAHGAWADDIHTVKTVREGYRVTLRGRAGEYPARKFYPADQPAKAEPKDSDRITPGDLITLTTSPSKNSSLQWGHYYAVVDVSQSVVTVHTPHGDRSKIPYVHCVKVCPFVEGGIIIAVRDSPNTAHFKKGDVFNVLKTKRSDEKYQLFIRDSLGIPAWYDATLFKRLDPQYDKPRFKNNASTLQHGDRVVCVDSSDIVATEWEIGQRHGVHRIHTVDKVRTNKITGNQVVRLKDFIDKNYYSATRFRKVVECESI